HRQRRPGRRPRVRPGAPRPCALPALPGAPDDYLQPLDPRLFFQAEDGIRGRNVTGVQTCALPICKFISKSCSLIFTNSDTLIPVAYKSSKITRSLNPFFKSLSTVLNNASISSS